MKPFGGEDILQRVDTPNIPDPIEGSEEYSCAVVRDIGTRDITALPWLPQLPEAWAQDIYDRIEDAERTHIAPNLREGEYYEGTAVRPDEIKIMRGSGSYLFTAEHATSPMSLATGKQRYPDAGTGGLASVLAEEFGTALIMTGRQTSNVPSDPDHPIKPVIRQELQRASGFLSIHGKAPGMFVHETDRSEIHSCIGLGRNVTEAMREFAKKIILAARDDLGLYVVLSNEQAVYIQERGDTRIKRLEDGNPKLSQLAATKPIDSSTTFTTRVIEETGRILPAMQMELTNLLRLTPIDSQPKKDAVSRVIGVALGFKLIEKVVKLSPAYAEEMV